MYSGLTGDYLLDSIPAQLRWKVVKHLKYPDHVKRACLEAAIASQRDAGEGQPDKMMMTKHHHYHQHRPKKAEGNNTTATTVKSLDQQKQNLLETLQKEFQAKQPHQQGW